MTLGPLSKTGKCSSFLLGLELALARLDGAADPTDRCHVTNFWNGSMPESGAAHISILKNYTCQGPRGQFHIMKGYKSVYWSTGGSEGQRSTTINWLLYMFLSPCTDRRCSSSSPFGTPSSIFSCRRLLSSHSAVFYQEPMHQNALLQVKMSEGRRGYEAVGN